MSLQQVVAPLLGAPLPVPATPPPDYVLVVRAANEDVPAKAIARLLALPYAKVLALLNRALARGEITHLPRTDWPAARTRSSPHAKHTAAGLGHADLEFLCRQTFRLTNLEAGFLAVLLRCLFVEKEKLHAVIEAQRYARHLRPDSDGVTDPKMVDVMICKLRKKLRPHAGLIVRTSWGKGYFLDQEVKDRIYRMLAVR